MTIPLAPSSLAAVRAIVSAKWMACAEAQGLKHSGASIDSAGNLGAWWSGDGRPRGSDHLDAALETLSRILEDEGYDVERGERDGRPTWRVTGEASHRGHRLYDYDYWFPARYEREERLFRERMARDAPRHAAASDTRGPKYTHQANVGKMAERSKR